MKKLSVIVIGAGSRGKTYSEHMRMADGKYEIVAVAEPLTERRNFIKEQNNLPEEMCFTDWRPLLEKGKIADIAIIATMDRDHLAPSIEALKLGYDLLLEKPIAPTNEECKEICETAEKLGRKVVICTVLRYTNLFKKLKEIIDSGEIGNIMSITHEECVGDVHQTHSFIRGNWGNEERSSFMLLQKSCHDIDILQWLIGKKCKKVQSFGALTYFTKENAPEGAPDYCVEGCPHGEECPYNAVKLYYDDKENLWFRGTSTKKPNPTDEEVMEAITKTQYGKCVFKCDNDVVDHQTCNLLFEDDVTVTFNMCAFNKGGRFIHIMGTKGELRAATDGDSPIEKYIFSGAKEETVDITSGDGITTGHGGGDSGIVNDFYAYLTGTYTGNSVPEIRESYINHATVFALEESRKTGKVIDVEEFIK